MFQVVVRVLEIVVCFVTSRVQTNVAFAHWILLPLMFPEAEIAHELVIAPSVAFPAFNVPSNSAFQLALTSHVAVMFPVTDVFPPIVAVLPTVSVPVTFPFHIVDISPFTDAYQSTVRFLSRIVSHSICTSHSDSKLSTVVAFAVRVPFNTVFHSVSIDPPAVVKAPVFDNAPSIVVSPPIVAHSLTSNDFSIRVSHLI